MDLHGTHNVFSVYAVFPGENQPERRLLGRFVTDDDSVFVIEDHEGLLGRVIQDGPINHRTERAIEGLRNSMYTQVVNEADLADGKHINLIPEEDFEQDPTAPQPEATPPEVQKHPMVGQEQPMDAIQQPQQFQMHRPPPVFDYVRAGSPPSVVEIHEGKVMMNGHLLNEDEIQRVLYNIKVGLATLRYRKK